MANYLDAFMQDERFNMLPSRLGPQKRTAVPKLRPTVSSKKATAAANKVVSQRKIGVNTPKRKPMPELPLGGTPKLPGSPRLATQFGSDEIEDLDTTRLTQVLGTLGQAIMGPYQESWQAKVGSAAVGLSQERAYSQALSRALSGDTPSATEFSHLSPEQQTQISQVQKDNLEMKLKREKMAQDYEIKLMGLDISENARKDKLDMFRKDLGLRKRGMAVEESRAETYKESVSMRERELEFKEGLLAAEEKAKVAAGLDKLSGEYEAVYKRIQKEVMDEMSKFGLDVTDPLEASPEDFQEMYDSYQQILQERVQEAISVGLLPGAYKKPGVIREVRPGQRPGESWKDFTGEEE